ncbi:DUF192 domain-containing protein [Halobacteriovorax sp. GB3]|uniref:DUF192 domain-containing protein n=1 Tax=Halobacteriovorax sp. GB3 TaxID=2719615 RepID=UPI00235FD709|nr:DUF192 domain-containing protein [Halobacteriovorax sp. GB3]MDD0853839.1 DUF192 domain-containing protein [Halobacteriovorax sp. GB3]
MSTFITQKPSNLIRKLLTFTVVLSFFCLGTVAKELNKNNGTHILNLSKNESLKINVALSMKEQAQGLSGVKSKDFAFDQAMLFVYKQEGYRQFWMPDTHFDLDIFFLGKNFEVLAVERSIKAHPGMKEPPVIARTQLHKCWYVLETRSDSPLSKRIKKGMKLSPPQSLLKLIK